MSERPKVFCIGMNKTGTTSLGSFLSSSGLRLAPQRPAELLLADWASGDLGRLVSFCDSYDAFQDVPFSLPGTYETLDAAFPNSRFILTVRQSSDIWFESLRQFHTSIIESLSESGMKACDYCYPGWLWEFHNSVFSAGTVGLFNRQSYIDAYEKHYSDVSSYFAGRANLLVLDLSQPGAAGACRQFLGIGDSEVEMPHLNKRTR